MLATGKRNKQNQLLKVIIAMSFKKKFTVAALGKKNADERFYMNIGNIDMIGNRLTPSGKQVLD